ncbi:hypothetical protein TURU_164094 [Turdus rufiventris]|nr:hypothetical protein TURU_164094 [Turdus rufiventris]
MVSEGGGGRDDPGIGAEIPLQPLEAYWGADIHPQPLEETIQKQPCEVFLRERRTSLEETGNDIVKKSSCKTGTLTGLVARLPVLREMVTVEMLSLPHRPQLLHRHQEISRDGQPQGEGDQIPNSWVAKRGEMQNDLPNGYEVFRKQKGHANAHETVHVQPGFGSKWSTGTCRPVERGAHAGPGFLVGPVTWGTHAEADCAEGLHAWKSDPCCSSSQRAVACGMEKFMEHYLLWPEPHAEAGKMCNELTLTPLPSSLHHRRGEVVEESDRVSLVDAWNPARVNPLHMGSFIKTDMNQSFQKSSNDREELYLAFW